MNESIRKSPLAAIPLALALAGCGGGSGGVTADGATSDGTTGTLTLAITDAPVDEATSVNVVFTAVTLKPAEGEPFTLACDEPAADPDFDCGGTGSRTIDLLTLTGSASETLLEDVSVPAGDYEWVRLAVDAADPEPGSTGASKIVFPGPDERDLVIPSGSQTGLKLVSGFTVPVGRSVALILDVDLRRAIREHGGPNDTRYRLRPALRLVDNADVGHLEGTIGNAFVQNECPTGDTSEGLAVYVYEGAAASLGDLGDATDPPLTTTVAELDTGTGDYVYRVGFLEAGSYTVAVTCEASADDPDVDGELDFVASDAVAIEAGETTEQDFI